jgi:predicted peptidase
MTNLASRTFNDPTTALALPYRLFVPNTCSTENPCGLLLFLHGAGERGHDNQAQLKNDALAWIQPSAQTQHPTMVVYPQCPLDMQWVDVPWDKGIYDIRKTTISQPLAAAMKLLSSLQSELPVDPDRLLVTGLSMGGYATWDLLVRNPTLFAGAVPLCGGGDPSQTAAICNLPVWAFHGDSDPAVPVSGSRKMIKALQEAGGNPRYTEVAGGGHDIWARAYRDVEVLHWLFSQKRSGCNLQATWP